MASEFDELQEHVIADMRSTYTETMIDHAMNPRNIGSIDDADGFASVTGPCGDTMEIWLRVRDDAIKDVAFWTDGCGTTIAAGSMVTELAKDKIVRDALRVGQQDVLDALGGLPEESVHCALLAANTLRRAVKDYLDYQKEPWKRAYRTR
ncbi:iron-sulfur cluster assembly scaffold protein [Chloroflexota bacterium]